MASAKTFVIPSSPADLKKLKDAMVEGSGALIRIDSEKEFLKDIAEKLSEELELPKSVIASLIRYYHKSNFEAKATEFDDFSTLWEEVSKV